MKSVVIICRCDWYKMNHLTSETWTARGEGWQRLNKHKRADELNQSGSAVDELGGDKRIHVSKAAIMFRKILKILKYWGISYCVSTEVFLWNKRFILEHFDKVQLWFESVSLEWSNSSSHGNSYWTTPISTVESLDGATSIHPFFFFTVPARRGPRRQTPMPVFSRQDYTQRQNKPLANPWPSHCWGNSNWPLHHCATL